MCRWMWRLHGIASTTLTCTQSHAPARAVPTVTAMWWRPMRVVPATTTTPSIWCAVSVGVMAAPSAPCDSTCGRLAQMRRRTHPTTHTPPHTHTHTHTHRHTPPHPNTNTHTHKHTHTQHHTHTNPHNNTQTHKPTPKTENTANNTQPNQKRITPDQIIQFKHYS